MDMEIGLIAEGCKMLFLLLGFIILSFLVLLYFMWMLEVLLNEIRNLRRDILERDGESV